MKFDDLDKEMRVYEESLDQFILPEMYMIARLDGRSFTKLTKDICDFEAPFDVKFRGFMVDTVKRLMDCGFKVIYGFTESDEISILFSRDENTFSRKVRKYNSILAAEASASFSLELGLPVAFDCRIIPLPTKEKVVDYFLWRQEDAHRNSLNSHCYWLLRKNGMEPNLAAKELSGKSIAFKNELLFANGINYNELPNWQKRGVGIWKETYIKEGFNPMTNVKETALRSCLKTEYNLPLGQEYADLIMRFVSE